MNARSKRNSLSGLNSTKTCGLGVPEILQAVSVEKPTVPVTVKLQPSLAEYVRENGGSAFIRVCLLDWIQLIANGKEGE